MYDNLVKPDTTLAWMGPAALKTRPYGPYLGELENVSLARVKRFDLAAFSSDTRRSIFIVMEV
jgi:hypothetical protein